MRLPPTGPSLRQHRASSAEGMLDDFANDETPPQFVPGSLYDQRLLTLEEGGRRTRRQLRYTQLFGLALFIVLVVLLTLATHDAPDTRAILEHLERIRCR